MVVVDTLTGFGKAYKTKNKTSEEAIKVMRSWIAQWGRPLELTVDAGPAYRERFREELLKLGVKVRHASAYSPQSNSHAERFVRTVKGILKKCGNVSQLELDEYIIACNAQVQVHNQGSALYRFMGRFVMTQIPNSFDSSFSWAEAIRARGERRERRVNKPARGVKHKHQIGEICTLQDPVSKKWETQATVVGVRLAPDGQILSYELQTDRGKTTRHRKYMRKTLPEVEVEAESQSW